MAQIVRTKPGVVTAQDGTYPELRGARKGGLTSQDVGARYEEATYRGGVYSVSTGGAGITLAGVNLFSTAVATFQPILALYNPLTSKVNLSILQSWLGVSGDPVSAGVSGAFFWVGNSGQSITNAQSATPFNCGTLKAAGGNAIGITNVVLAGAVGNPILIRPVSSTLDPTAEPSTANTILSSVVMEETAGTLMVPPGGYVGFANGISNTTVIVVAGICYEEIPL